MDRHGINPTPKKQQEQSNHRRPLLIILISTVNLIHLDRNKEGVFLGLEGINLMTNVSRNFSSSI
jgi:hypothetical protein